MEDSTIRGMGWLNDYPDFRDYTVDQDKVSDKLQRLGQRDSIKAMLTKAGVSGTKKAKALPSKVDLSPWCSIVEDQDKLGSCTANAAVGLIEYFENRAFGKYTDGSRLFVYKVTRNLAHLTGDTGAFLRNAMGAMVLFGVPPEEYWPYKIADFDVEPPAFCYAFAQNYQAVTYYRLDPPETKTDSLLAQIRQHLAAGIPAMFGFTVYTSISQAKTIGKIPFPVSGEKILGGHAIDAVGYDDGVKVKNAGAKGAGSTTTGALLIRNSWGTEWGDKGYAWLPYDYVLKGLAVDWWVLLKNEWIDTGNFKS